MNKLLTVAMMFFLAACTREIPPMKKAFMDKCLAGYEPACDVLSAAAVGDQMRFNAAMQNWTAATNNTANWAIQQQNTGTYSGGGGYSGSICTVNQQTGQEFCR